MGTVVFRVDRAVMTARTQGTHHIGLTVSNLVAMQTFFEQALGFAKVGEKPDYPAVFVSDGVIMLTLWQAKEPSNVRAFDRSTNLGLHHLALTLAKEVDLDELHEQLRQRDDVEIEFVPEQLGDRPIRHMMLRIPDRIRLELVKDSPSS